MADYITSTSASLHSSPSRKRTRESHTTRSSSNSSSSHKTAASVTSNSEVMDSSTSEITASLPSSTQPQDYINSVKNDHTAESSSDTTSNGIEGSLNGELKPAPIAVSIIIFISFLKCDLVFSPHKISNSISSGIKL